MAKVQLKVNMIFGGAFHNQGTVMEAREIPPNLRQQSEYVGEPGSVESLYPSPPIEEVESDSSASVEEGERLE